MYGRGSTLRSVPLRLPEKRAVPAAVFINFTRRAGSYFPRRSFATSASPCSPSATPTFPRMTMTLPQRPAPCQCQPQRPARAGQNRGRGRARIVMDYVRSAEVFETLPWPPSRLSKTPHRSPLRSTTFTALSLPPTGSEAAPGAAWRYFATDQARTIRRICRNVSLLVLPDFKTTRETDDALPFDQYFAHWDRTAPPIRTQAPRSDL